MSTHEHRPGPHGPDPIAAARDAAFDAAVRSAHAASLDHLSPRVHAQLAQRRRAALAGKARHASPWWRAAWPIAAAAAIGALAIGLQVRAPVPAPSPVVATAPTDPATTYDTLDESPDLYVWLASDDAAALAME